MGNDTLRFETPEGRELARLKTELATAEAGLGAIELDLASLQNRLAEFQSRYYRQVACKYAELDELEAQMAEKDAVHSAATEEAREAAQHAREKAKRSREEVDQRREDVPVPDFVPSAELKSLFRTLAAKVHPDLAPDEADRLYRTEFFKSVNAAYRDQDYTRLKELASEWELRPESIEGDDVGAQVVRLLRKIAQVQTRTAAALSELAVLRGSEVNTLFVKAEELARQNRDLLAEMARDVDRQIEELRQGRESRAGRGG